MVEIDRRHMRIYLIRHGETDWNKELRLQGREDVPMNACGEQQALECGNALNGIEVDFIVTSPLQRAKKTAMIIAKQTGVDKVIIEEDLIERDFGEASGITYKEKNLRYANCEIPGYESTEELMERMDRVVKKYFEICPNGHVLMVSHGGAINSLLSEITGGELGSGKTRLKNACITLLEVDTNQMQLVDYNLDAHEFKMKYVEDVLL